MRWLLIAWAVCTWAGCDDDQPVPPARRGLGEQPSPRRARGGSRTSTRASTKASKRDDPPGRAAPFEVRRTARVTKDASSGTRPEKELDGRLRTMLGETVGCLEGHLVSDPPERIGIGARVVVTASGVVGRASVEAPHVDGEGRRCIERELERRRFEAPVADAPRSVRATIELRRGDR